MCVTGDTLVLTSDGYRQVGDLVDEDFSLIFENKIYYPIGYGFSSTGNKNVIKIHISNGSYVKVTENHELLTVNGWLRADELRVGDVLKINDGYEHETIIDIKNLGCFYVYDCQIHEFDRYISEGGFINKTQ